eukprot:jgi/Tetstr1/464870/TSEL_009607.t2
MLTGVRGALLCGGQPAARVAPRKQQRAHPTRSRPIAAAPSTPPVGLERFEADKERQLLRFREPLSGRSVVLVGCMHYNPASIALAGETVRELAGDGRLGALVLETCAKRWRSTLKKQAPGSPLRVILDNEFQAAVEAAAGRGTLVLGDQPIAEVTGDLAALARATVVDALSPVGGWRRLANDLERGYRREFAGVPGVPSLSPADLFLDPRLLLCLPVSLLRYPLGMLIRSPRFALPAFGTLAGLDQLLSLVPIGTDVGGAYIATPQETFITTLFAFLDVMQVILLSFSSTYTCTGVLLSRCFLVGLLEKRNDILARSVRDACLEAPLGTTVVAVLGAAHLNGIQARLLTEDPLEGVVPGVKAADADMGTI